MSRSRTDLCDIFAQENSFCFKICISFVLSHSSAENRFSNSEDDRNVSSQWMTLVCPRPSSVCVVLPSEITLQCISQLPVHWSKVHITGMFTYRIYDDVFKVCFCQVIAVIKYPCIKYYKSVVFIHTSLKPVGKEWMIPVLPSVC